jgi:Metallo-beta-lactamase superfamily
VTLVPGDVLASGTVPGGCLLEHVKGLHDLGDGCHTWLLPDGSWGWSNSGLVTGSGTALLIDTHFDLALTREVLEGVAPVTDAHPLGTLVNTHSDGDHVFGNELVAARGVEIVASAAAAELMTQEQVDMLVGVKKLPGATGEFARHIFGPFEFAGITATGPDRTFTGEESLDVGGREGPVSGKAEVSAMREYLVFVEREARKRFEDGLSVDDAIASIDLGRYAQVPEHGRLAQNVLNVYQQLDPSMDRPNRLTVLSRIAALEGWAASFRRAGSPAAWFRWRSREEPAWVPPGSERQGDGDPGRRGGARRRLNGPATAPRTAGRACRGCGRRRSG